MKIKSLIGTAVIGTISIMLQGATEARAELRVEQVQRDYQVRYHGLQAYTPLR